MTDKKLHTETQSISVKLLKFSMPLILSGILQQLYNWADAFVVGNVNGELALAAVGSTSSVINFYVLAITGFTLGAGILRIIPVFCLPSPVSWALFFLCFPPQVSV